MLLERGARPAPQYGTQAFGAFIEGFVPAFRPLLASIKGVFDAAIVQGAASAAAAAQLRSQALAARAHRASAARAERARSLDHGAARRAALHTRVASAQARAEKARSRASRAGRDLAAAREALAHASRLLKGASAAAARLHQAAAAAAARHALLGAGALDVLEPPLLSGQVGGGLRVGALRVREAGLSVLPRRCRWPSARSQPWRGSGGRMAGCS
jgi:hypothetical protein